MLFQPAIIALLIATATSVALLAAAAPFAARVLASWDLASGSERQLRMERRTYLVSTVLSFVFASELVALLLFVFNADRMSVLFVGAMCAVGTLNVNAYGFPALLAQIALFFLASTWLILNRLDNQAPDYPLVRVKYAMLLAIVPVAALTLGLQFAYFLGLKADVITSCCGSLFGGGTETLGGDLAGLPPRPAMLGFYAAILAAVAAGGWSALRGRGGIVLAATSGAAFLAALAGIVSFVSLYAYEHPHHHCPFCLLKPEYDFQGYALYLPLFLGTAAGLGAGVIQPFARIPSLRQLIPQRMRSLGAFAGAMFLLFLGLASAIILRSNLVLMDG